MSSHQPESGQSLKASYIFLMIVLTVGSFFLYSALPWIVALAVNGPLELHEVFQTSAPLVKHSILWNGKLCVPHVELNVFNPTMSQQSLDIIDLKTGDSRKIQAQFPPGQLRIVPDGETLWCLSGSTVYRVLDGSVEQTSTGTTLGTEPAFLYDGKLAVITETKSVLDSSGSTFQLQIWTGATWQHVGRVLLPTIVDESESSDQVSPTIPFQGPVETRVLTVDGQTHAFCTDGTRVLYSNRLEILTDGTASALVPENSTTQVPGWILAGTVSEFQVGVDSRGLLAVGQESNFQNGTMNTTSTVMRLVDGTWKVAFEFKRTGFVIDPTLVSDGTRAFIVNQTLTNKVSLNEIGETGTTESRVSLKSGLKMERMAHTVQNCWWVVIPVLLLYALAATRLMGAYRDSRYEYGKSTVEFASLFRRTLARMVDWMLVLAPIQIVQWILIGSQAELQEWWMKAFETFDISILTTLLYIGLATVLYALFWLVGVSYFEGRWGVTPGKWLVGIRVVRTTLRPCGFLRAAVRELMLLIDGILCFGWLPGVFCITLTTCRQRMGDMLADTIVIRKPSAATADEATVHGAGTVT